MSAVLVEPASAEASDGTLVAAVLSGDQPSAAVLFRRYHARLVRRMGYWTRDRAHAEDLAQDAWLKALSALERFDVQAPFWPWLRRIADNTARSDLRRALAPCGQHRTVAVDELTLDLVPSRTDEHGRVEDGAEVASALAGIPARQRDAFLTVAHAGTPIPVAAGMFGLNENAFRQLYARARRSLRAQVDSVLGTAPLLWLQRWMGSGRDTLGAASNLTALQVGAAAVTTVVALIVIAPGVGTSASAEESQRHPALMSVAANDGVDALGSRRQGQRSLGQRMAPAIQRARDAEPATSNRVAAEPPPGQGIAVPEARIAGGPVRADQRRPKNPDVRLGVRTPVGPTREIGYEAKDSSATPAELAACEAAKLTPVTFCDD